MPDYEIIEWNEENFDVNIIPYTKDAYKAGKYAFVSDFARFWIIYNYGGVYFDTDVEVIRPMDDILERGPYMGFERDPKKNVDGLVNPGLGFAADKGNTIIKKIIDYYETLAFTVNPETLKPTETIVQHTTKVLTENGLKKDSGTQNISGLYVYPTEYFAPIHFVSKKLHITRHTHTIHRYMASWTGGKKPLIKKLRRILPEWMLIFYNRIKHPENYNQKQS